MSLKDRVLKELEVQQVTEGLTFDLLTVRQVLEECKTEKEFFILVDIKHCRYGKLSYETHRFYYPSKLLNTLLQLGADLK